MIKVDQPVYIIDCCRTAIGNQNKSLKAFTAAQLAGCALKGIIERTRVKPEQLAEVILGNVVSAGTGQNLAREAVALAGLPIETPAYVVNSVCGSGMQALILGIQKVLLESSSFVIAGAAESATRSPQLVYEEGVPPISSLQKDGLTCPIAQKSMGLICEDLAVKYGISRQAQDEYTLESHHRACCARKEGRFQAEIIPVRLASGEFFVNDERPRENTSMEKLARLPSAFSANGTITAGNSSAPADGASAFLLASGELIEKFHWNPLAKILGVVSLGVDPKQVFSEGTKAVERCLQQCQLTLGDIDLFEVTEAFAAQAIYVRNHLKLSSEKMNIFGGDVALGHPLGVAGSRVLVTLTHALRSQKKKRGLGFVSFGAGGAIAVVVESF